VTALENSGLQLVSLYGEEGLCQEAHNAFRFKRIYVNPEYGVPFLSSSEIISLRPRLENYLSLKHTKNLSKLLIHKWDILISCSGTIGNVIPFFIIPERGNRSQSPDLPLPKVK